MKPINMKSALLLFVMTLAGSVLYAQDYAFKVLGAKGTTTIDGNALKIGTSLTAEQLIAVGEGAYLGLAHHSGKTVEIKKAGEYKVKDLEAKIASAEGSTSGKIAMFIIDELTSDDNKSNRFSQSIVKTGSVMRATQQNSIQVLLPAQTEFLPGHVTIGWFTDAEEAPTKYTLVALNLKGEEVIRQEVEGTSVTLDLSKLSSFDSKLLKYHIEAEGDVKSEEHGLRMPKVDAKQLQKELAELPSEDTPLNHYLRAEFFASKGLVANAISAYEAAGEAFVEPYQEFLKAFKLTKEAVSEKATESNEQGE